MLWFIVTLLVISGTILLFLGVNALQRRDTPVVMAFSLAMFCASLWAYSFAMEVVSNTLETKILWANIQFLGIELLPLAWFAMTLYYTGQPRWTIRSLPFLSFVPLVITFIIWSNPYHHLFRGSPSLEIISPTFSVLSNDYGIFFYAVSVPFGYLLFLASLVLSAKFWLKSPPIYRRQRFILFFSLLLPLLVDVLYVFGITPIPNFNFTAITFSIAGLLISWNIFFFRFFDFMPLAKDVVIETMQVGVIVLDKQGFITDINPEAEKITGISAAQNIGTLAKQVFPKYASFLDLDVEGTTEISLEKDGETSYYAARVSPILGKNKHLLGRVITLNNVSERVQLYQKVKEASLTDSLTGVLNRRAFMAKGESEIKRSLRHKRRLSIIMMDVDDFKKVNDKYGHRMGDKALFSVAECCRQQMRTSDEIARYGGDEFTILLPETGAEDAITLAERISNDIAHTRLSIETEQVSPLRVSIGVAEFDGKETLNSLLHRADQALYDVKRSGKGKISLNEI